MEERHAHYDTGDSGVIGDGANPNTALDAVLARVVGCDLFVVLQEQRHLLVGL
jgi:hypothetical protein